MMAVVSIDPIKKIVIFLASIVICVSCGIDDVVFLYPPIRRYDQSDSVAQHKRYCQFETAHAENNSSAAEYFKGTEIYYRIYEREADCTEERAQIDRHNESNPSTAAQYLQDTRKYCRLGYFVGARGQVIDRRPLIERSTSNTTVRFRLQHFGATDPALLTVAGRELGTPYRDRQIEDAKREFSPHTIAVGDLDVHASSGDATHDDCWYVNFYAVSYGYDKNFRPLYSSLTPLGFIRIEKS